MAAVKVAVQQLLAGCPASAVIAEMRNTYTTPESMKKHMSLARSKIMEGGNYSSRFNPTPLRAFAAANPEIASFLSASLKQQCKTQREQKFSPTWSEQAEECLASLQLLPETLDDFVMSKADSCTIKRRAATRLREKNTNVVTVAAGQSLLAHLTLILENATEASDIAVLLCALAVVSGRRSTELLNGRSTFQAIPEKPTLALFEGQLKTKSDTPRPYVIPLCCNFDTFSRGLHALRAIQHHDGGVAHLTNTEVSDRYRWITISTIPELGSQLANVHALRSLYIALIYDNLYECPSSFNETARVCLGHKELTESLHYAGVRVRGCEEIRHEFGKLELLALTSPH
jgi:hypothetical protein